MSDCDMCGSDTNEHFLELEDPKTEAVITLCIECVSTALSKSLESETCHLGRIVQLETQLAAARAKAVELAGEVDETILRCENCEHEYVSGCSEPCISCIAGDEITRKHHSKYASAKTAADVLKEWG
jgi:hypothetical protein